MIRKFAFALAFVVGAAAFAPLASSAQEYPPPPPQGQPPPPSQGQPPPPPQGQPPPPPQGPYGEDVQGFHLRGTVAYFQPYFLILDAGGRRIPVHLHVGTVILPTGLTLVPGMYVGINGYWIRGYYRGSSFVADRIVLLR
jgi:hypothetical protein